MKPGVIHRKAAVEAGSKSVLRIERDRPNKSGGVITTSPKQIWNEWKSRRQPASQLAGAVRLRISARKYGGVRGHSQGRLRIGLFKHDALTGHAIKAWCNFRLRAQEAHPVGA